MKLLLRKLPDCDIYKFYVDGKETRYTVRKDGFLTDVYYLVYYGNAFRGRFGSMQEVKEYLCTKVLDETADMILKGK